MFVRTSLLLAASMVATPVAAQDRDGADHPLLTRYPGTEIRSYRATGAERLFVPTAAVTNQARAKGVTLEGEVTHISYMHFPAVSRLEMVRFYQTQLAAKGFALRFNCTGDVQCGREMQTLLINSGKVAPEGIGDAGFSGRYTTMVATRGNDWIVLMIEENANRSIVYEGVIEHARQLGAR